MNTYIPPLPRRRARCDVPLPQKAEAVKVGDGERVALTSTEQAEVELEAFEEKEEALEGDLKELGESPRPAPPAPRDGAPSLARR